MIRQSGRQWGKAGNEYAKTCMGNNCYSGSNTVIVKGVTIGDGCLIGANSLVLHDISAGAKAHGTPCREVSHDSW